MESPGSDQKGVQSRVCSATSSTDGKRVSFSKTTRPVMSVTRSTTPGNTKPSSGRSASEKSAPSSSLRMTCRSERSISCPAWW